MQVLYVLPAFDLINILAEKVTARLQPARRADPAGRLCIARNASRTNSW